MCCHLMGKPQTNLWVLPSNGKLLHHMKSVTVYGQFDHFWLHELIRKKARKLRPKIDVFIER